MTRLISSMRSVSLAVATVVGLGGLATLSAVALTPAHAQAATAVRGLPDFADLAEAASPSVVNIRTLEKSKAMASGPGGNGMDEDMQELFRRFFGDRVPLPNTPRPGPRSNPQPGPDAEETPRGVGSGFILTADGYIMTNAHVVDGADEVIVTLTDKREFKAKIIGADKRSDVAVVKIEAMGLPAVKIGDTSKMGDGHWLSIRLGKHRNCGHCECQAA
jgi:serine protease Do